MDFNNTALKTTLQPYLEKLQHWWNTRLPREQGVIKLLALVLAIFLLYSLVWQPMATARDMAKDQYLAASQTYQWFSANEAAVMAMKSSTSSTASTAKKDWVMNINQSAQMQGLRLKGFTPKGSQEVSVVLDKQPFSGLIGWLTTLRREGITATNIVISETTSTPGQVNAHMTLKSE